MKDQGMALAHVHLNTSRRLAAEVDDLKEELRLAAELQIRTGQEADAEIERLKREVDYWMNLDAQALEAENERLTEQRDGYYQLSLRLAAEIKELRALNDTLIHPANAAG